MKLGDNGTQVFFEIKIYHETNFNNIKNLINDKTGEEYRFGVEMITTGENLDIGIRSNLLTVSSVYNTRKEALEAAEKFIEDYKTKLKQQHLDNTEAT